MAKTENSTSSETTPRKLTERERARVALYLSVSAQLQRAARATREGKEVEAGKILADVKERLA
jgi:hypothetical protein